MNENLRVGNTPDLVAAISEYKENHEELVRVKIDIAKLVNELVGDKYDIEGLRAFFPHRS